MYRPETCRDFSKWAYLHCVKIFKKSLVEIFKTSLQAKNSLISRFHHILYIMYKLFQYFVIFSLRKKITKILNVNLKS